MITQREQSISRTLNHTLRIKIVPANKGHRVKIKGSTHQEHVTIINIYAPNINIKAPKYIK